MTDQQTPTPPPPFDPNAEHQAKPHLRAVRGFPVQGSTPDGQQVQMMGLADQRQISDKMVATIPAAQQVLPLMDGTRSVDDIAAAVKRAEEVGAMVAYPPTRQGTAGMFAIVIHDSVQHGFWQK